MFNKPDQTEGSADGNEGSSNGECSPVEKILKVSSTSPTSIKVVIPSYFGDTDEDGWEEVGQLEIELKPGLTCGLDGSRQTKEKRSCTKLFLFAVNLPVNFLLLIYFVLNFFLFIHKLLVLYSKGCLSQHKHLHILNKAKDL